jgi:3-deoxy-D-manno-octulosonic-acid transferase
MRFFYNIFITIYTFFIKVASLFNKKAKLWVEGRKNIFRKLEESINPNDKIIWFHVASLGEFEQARPVIEKIKEQFRDHKILLTFFSPSGYEIRKNYDKADYVFYLPADTRKNAEKFIKTVNPRLAIFVKYEFWFNYINELYKNKIPLLMISVIFRPEQHFFRFWGRWFRRQLQKITWIFVQNEKSCELLGSIKIRHAEISGDTRFDRVYQIVKEDRRIPEIESFRNNSLIITAGSTWPPDEDIILHILQNTDENLKVVLAPHVVDKSHISDILHKFKKFNPVLFTEFDDKKAKNSRILIINTTGLLAYAYRYSAFSYVGGGFGAGIHSLLEPVTFGHPVLFGPNYHKFQEAHDLIAAGCGFPVSNKEEAMRVVHMLLNDKEKLRELSARSKDFVCNNVGATATIMEKVKEYILEPSNTQL